MTARKNNEDKAAEKDAKAADETAAARGEKETETSEQAAQREIPDAPKEAEDARSDESKDLVDEFGGESGVEGALGIVSEKDAEGNEYDVPWTYLTVEDVEEATQVRTSDWDDPARSWTNQATEDDDETPVALVAVQQQPGQTFRVSELPDPQVMKDAGINVAQFLSGVPVRADVPHEAPRRGTPA